MSDRMYRVLIGIAILLITYFDSAAAMLALVGVLFLEGLSGLRLTLLVDRLRRLPSQPSPQRRWPPADEQVWRLMVGLMLLLTAILFNELFWFMPWFMGFAILGAGISGVCPMLLSLRLSGLPPACATPDTSLLKPGSVEVPYRSSLPLRITGIVFWGMMLAGLLIAVVTMQSREEAHGHQRQLNLAMAVSTIQDHFEGHPELRIGKTPKPPAEMDAIRRQYGFSALELRTEAGLWRIQAPATTEKQLAQTINVNRPDGGVEPLRVTAYMPSLDPQLKTERKHVLIFTGLVAVVFGLILQAILKGLLARPFRGMVGTAQRFAQGEKDTRFDSQRADEFGFLAGFINQALDTANRSETALAQEKERAEVTLRSITDAVISTDAHGRMQFMNPVAESLTALRTPEIQGRRLCEHIHFIDELTREELADPVRECLESGEAVHLQAGNELLINHDGLEIPVAGTAAPMRDEQGEIVGCVVALQDVRHARELTRRLVHQASRDALTGLYNRHSFETQLKRVLEEHDPANPNHALFYLDLDQFKIVNDTCGHGAGDQMLRGLADTLHEALRHDDILARLGGDEFGVLLKNCSREQAEFVANKLRMAVEAFRFSWSDQLFQVGVSIGVVPIAPGAAEPATLLSAADLACYAAKEAGRNRIHVYEQGDDTLKQWHGEMHWATRLTQALDQDEFELFIQPIVSLAPEDPHRHWEVLLRLRREGGEFASPGAFMSAAERYGLMPRIDRWVIHNAFAKFADQARGEDLIAINLSGASLSDPSLIEYVRATQAQTGLPWTRICFEVTETVAIRNMGMASQFIQQMRAQGCKFALDDFGSGLSSFAYLKNLPVDFLKIDGAFIRDIVSDPIDRSMVEAISQVGRIMGIKTIAEWVENRSIAETIKEIGIDYAQGHYYGRPESCERPYPKAPSEG